MPRRLSKAAVFALDKAASEVHHPADSHQVGGKHYQAMPIQPWTAMEAWMTPEQFAGFLRGNVIKYTARCHAKGGLEDLQKARHYLDKLIEHATAQGGAA